MTTKDFFKINDYYIFKAKEPISALTHFVAFVLAIIGMPIILIKAVHDGISTLNLIPLSIYMLSMILLYGASASYHSFNISNTFNKILKKIDHMSIFILIAGTYTPICLITLNNSEGINMLIAIWSIALIGIIFKAFWVTCPKYLSSLIYLFMGWLCLFALPEIISKLSLGGFLLLLMGGIFYSVGAIIYALKPRFLKNEYFNNHELFHCFIMLGSLMHYLLMIIYII